MCLQVIALVQSVIEWLGEGKLTFSVGRSPDVSLCMNPWVSLRCIDSQSFLHKYKQLSIYAFTSIYSYTSKCGLQIWSTAHDACNKSVYSNSSPCWSWQKNTVRDTSLWRSSLVDMQHSEWQHGVPISYAVSFPFNVQENACVLHYENMQYVIKGHQHACFAKTAWYTRLYSCSVIAIPLGGVHK